MKNNVLFFLCLLLFCPMASFLFSQESKAQEEEDFFAMSLDELVNAEITIATGYDTSLREASASATVINRRQIRAMGAISVQEVLENVPGVHVSRKSKQDPLISIRGIHPNDSNPHVLMLINGTSINGTLDGGRPTAWRSTNKPVS